MGRTPKKGDFFWKRALEMNRNRLHALTIRYQEPIRYMIVGSGTTIINYGVFLLLTAAHLHYLTSNMVAWMCAVAFSYYANSAWVYRATSHLCFQEALAFATSRAFTLGLETVLLFFIVEAADMSELCAKIIVSIVVVTVNYITGLWIYKRKPVHP